jgi:hypothetical protein
MARARLYASAVGLAFLLAGCHASYPSAPSNPTIVALQVHYPRALGPVSVISGFGLLAYTLNSDGAYEDVTTKAAWSSSDPSVISRGAVVPTFGPMPFVAIGPGSADITAQYLGFSTSVPMVTFRADRPAFPSLTISSPGDPRTVGTSAPSVARVQRSATDSQDVTTVATWSSSDPHAVSVAADGSVRAIAPGTAQITASYNGLTAWYGLSVAPASR